MHDISDSNDVGQYKLGVGYLKKKHFRVNIRRHCEEKSESETASQRQMERRAACTRMMTGNETRCAMARNTTHPQSHVEAGSVPGFQWHKTQH